MSIKSVVNSNACIQTTAMYYMCYYTMMHEPILDMISKCHVRNEETNDWGKTYDFRDHNRYAFECAMHLFCPGQLQLYTYNYVSSLSFDNTLCIFHACIV